MHLPPALATGNLDIVTNAMVRQVLVDENGKATGVAYVDRLIGRHARAAKRAAKSHGWGVPGLSWMPGDVPDPFGHE